MRIACNYITLNTTTHGQKQTAQKLTAREIHSRQARPINIQMSTPQKIDPLYNYANIIQAALNTISTTNHPQKRKRVPGVGHTEPPLVQGACKYTENDLFSERGRKRHQAGDQAKEDKHISACPMHHSIPGSVGHNFCVTKSRPSYPVGHDRHLFKQGGIWCAQQNRVVLNNHAADFRERNGGGCIVQYTTYFSDTGAHKGRSTQHPLRH